MQSVSVIIPHYSDLHGLDRCLSGMARQTYPAELIEVIVADNRSPQGAAAVEECIAGRARMVTSRTEGAGPTRNAGVAASSAPMLAFIDSDCVADPEWLAEGIAALSENDIVGGAVNVTVEHEGPLSPAEGYEMCFAFNNEAYVHKKGFSVTANLFASRRVFEDVGPFMAKVSEDVDWCHRATAKGYSLGFVPTAVVSHPARRSWVELRSKWLRIHSESYALRASTVGARLRWLVRSWAMPLSIVAHSPKIWSNTRLTNARDRRAAFAGLVHLRLWRFVDGHRLALGLKRSQVAGEE